MADKCSESLRGKILCRRTHCVTAPERSQSNFEFACGYLKVDYSAMGIVSSCLNGSARQLLNAAANGEADTVRQVAHCNFHRRLPLSIACSVVADALHQSRNIMSVMEIVLVLQQPTCCLAPSGCWNPCHNATTLTKNRSLQVLEAKPQLATYTGFSTGYNCLHYAAGQHSLSCHSCSATFTPFHT